MKLKLIFIAVAMALLAGCLTGCVDAAIGVAAYSSAVDKQEHAAYTEYYFATAPAPVVPEDQWIKEYEMRQKYTDYYHDLIAQNVNTNAPVLQGVAPFDEWKTNELARMKAQHEKLIAHKK